VGKLHPDRRQPLDTMKKLLLLLAMLVPLSGWAQGGITVSPPFNPLNMGPLGASSLSLSGTAGIIIASTNGTVLFDVKSNATDALQVADGFGNATVKLIAAEWNFGNGLATFQYPLTFWVSGGLAFDPGFGNGDTYVTRASAGGIQVGTTLGGSNGSLTLATLTVSGSSNIVTAGSFSGTGTATTAFVVTIGKTMANTTYKVNVTPTAALAAAVFYVTSKSTTQFTVTYIAGLTGTVTFDWAVFP
jgi:hypothetical protein